MENLKSKNWWNAAITRAIKTMAQTFTAMVGTAMVLTDINWIQVGSATMVAAIISLAMSLQGLPEVEE